jgi:integrase
VYNTKQEALLETPEGIDDLACEYVQERFDENPASGQRNEMQYVLSGLLMIAPQLRGHMGRTARALRGWRRLVQPQPTTPATWGITLLLSAWLFAHGYAQAGLLSLLSFDCYLRAHEALNLLNTDIIWQGDVRLGKRFRDHAGVRLANTKTGRDQWVEVKRALVARLLRAHCRRRETTGQARLFTISYKTYLHQIHLAARGLGLPPLSPHSFRRGGATQDRLDGRSFDYIQARGRWACQKTCKMYIDTARAFLATFSLSPRLTKCVQDLERAPTRHFARWE